MLLREFKDSCINLRPDEVVDRFLIERPSFFFEKFHTGKEYDFKKDIANILTVHIRDIVIVGSAKLGFSMKPDPTATGHYTFSVFDDKRTSDLDIAIISSDLFDRQMQSLYDHTDLSKADWYSKTSFANYVLKGRLAIRYLPRKFKFTKEVKEVQRKYKMEYKRDINLEIYKSWYYFETYHQQNIRRIGANFIA